MKAKLEELLGEVEALKTISEEEEERYRKEAQFKCYKEGWAAGAAAMADEFGDKLKKIIQQIT